MTTTAEYRKQALLSEMQTLWTSAAWAWEKAVDAYPPGGGALAELDKAKMSKRALACHAARRMRDKDAESRT